MGGKSSKTKKEPSVSNVKNAGGGDQQLKSSKDNLSSQSNSTTSSPKLKKKSIKRKLTKAFSRKSKIEPEKAPDNTYASSITTTLKRTNTTGSLPPPKSISISESRPNIPIIHRSDTLTLTTPYAPITPRDFKPAAEPEKKGDDVDVSNSEDGTNEDNQNEAPGAFERAATTGLYSQSEGDGGDGGRVVALPKRMSKAYAFHLQIASKEIGERGAELQRIIQSEKPICDVYEDNPFKKGWCRLCKHPKNVHRDPYSDIMNELDEDFY